MGSTGALEWQGMHYSEYTIALTALSAPVPPTAGDVLVHLERDEGMQAGHWATLAASFSHSRPWGTDNLKDQHPHILQSSLPYTQGHLS